MITPLDKIKDLFSEEKRPYHFTDYTHCEECADHDATMQQFDNTNLPVEKVNNQAWDPVCFLTPEGFRYYYPRLCELAYGRGDAFYLESFLMHLENNIHLLTADEKEATFELLVDISEKLPDDIELNYAEADVDRVSEKLMRV